MKNKKMMIILSFVLVLTMFAFFTGCKSASDNISEEIGEELAEGYIKGLTGGNTEVDIESGDEWPENMPEKVPEFKKGAIENSSYIKAGDQLQITIVILGVKPGDIDEYLAELEGSVFEQLAYSKYEDTIVASYTEDSNMLSLEYDAELEEAIITFVGN